MEMAIIVPIMGGLHESKSFWGSIVGAGLQSDLIVFDNGASVKENQQSFFERYVFPQMPQPERCRYWPQEDNLGLVQTMQKCYMETDYDVLCFIHNDLYIYSVMWDQEVLEVFETHPKTGLVGIFGAKGIFDNSVRFHVWNNLVEAEIHGYRLVSSAPPLQVGVLDGMFMAVGRKMLDERNGVDTNFDIHHYYDLDLSLESIDRGFDNFVIPLYAHHVSGQTACKPIFQDWASAREGQKRGMEEPMPRAEYEVYFVENLARFTEKWRSRLPYHVDKGWSSTIHG